MLGELLDTLIFIAIAFYGALPFPIIVSLFISNYIFKVGVEILFTPVTYFLANKLKRVEHEDYYDRKTNFNPFTLDAKI
jgi:uncharacterized PurR-regulated membrane protein YhhQ (DUF165 family)